MTDSTKATMKSWATGALSAFIVGVSSAGMAWTIDPEHFGPANLKHMAIVAALTGVVSLFRYLRSHPVPGDTETE